MKVHRHLIAGGPSLLRLRPASPFSRFYFPIRPLQDLAYELLPYIFVFIREEAGLGKGQSPLDP